MHTIQLEHKAWIARKYPGQIPKVPAVGCLEEAGELVHAIAKIELVNTWGEDSRHKLVELRHKLTDAIGDCGIFACSLCNANEWNFEEMWHGAAEMYVDEGVSSLDLAIRLTQDGAHVALEPTDCERLYFYISQLKAVAQSLGLDAEACIRTTWQEVKCR